MTWCQPSELLHLLILGRQAVLGHDSALLHNDDEDGVAATAHLIQLGGACGPLSSAPLHQAVHLSHGHLVSVAAQRSTPHASITFTLYNVISTLFNPTHCALLEAAEWGSHPVLYNKGRQQLH